MGKSRLLSLLIYLLLELISLPPLVVSISDCNGPCRTLNDCNGRLICINGKCNDDPDLGTHICQGTTPSPQPGGCNPSGTLTCKGTYKWGNYSEQSYSTSVINCRCLLSLSTGKTYPTYECSPTVTSSTPAKLTNNDFSQGGDGGGPSECDGKYHSNKNPIVALSTGWYNSGTQCNHMIRIQASNGRSVDAMVVDECDSRNGCNAEHAGQPPCKNNIVDGSDAVWDALGLNKEEGVVDITWSNLPKKKTITSVMMLQCML
ncbi:hypothetical protein RHMOL_Rhmol13G0121400 [Rhododendron molle]|uniref:Uncharacterized protein n=1 Tax=Rhododendron molle TaxID=49168 RepID=A0ACC0L6W0_RHOML|nr:hypothetical protein RHMOL_Rhmol13G0121400 [Rhododendron molle]